jgi:3-hydroxybutyryl-CoA dehydratase
MTEQPESYGTPLSAMTDAWATMASTVFKTAAAANCATAAAFGTSDEAEQVEQLPPDVPSVAYEEVDWTFERTVSQPEDIGVGDTVQFSKLVSEEDVQLFARVSGDTNRLHLDDDFAQQTRFEGRIVHGTLASGLISAALARLPGLTIYLGQDMEFRRPVQVGDRITAMVEVVEDLGDSQFRLRTTVHDEDQDETIIDGEATVLIDDPPTE